MQVAAEELGNVIPIRKNRLGALWAVLFMLAAPVLAVWGTAGRLMDGSVGSRLLVAAIDVGVSLIALVAAARLIRQMRTEFTEQAIVRRGLWRTTVIRWDHIIVAQSGLGYTLRTPEDTININPYAFRDVAQLDELIARKVPSSVRWVR